MEKNQSKSAEELLNEKIQVGDVSMLKRYVVTAFWNAALKITDEIEELRKTPDNEEEIQYLTNEAALYMKYHDSLIGLETEESEKNVESLINPTVED